jgi:hypothetical protein
VVSPASERDHRSNEAGGAGDGVSVVPPAPLQVAKPEPGNVLPAEGGAGPPPRELLTGSQPGCTPSWAMTADEKKLLSPA